MARTKRTKSAPEVVETTGSEVPAVTKKGPSKSRLAALGKVAKKIDGWEQPRQALTRVKALPTEFIQIDDVLGIGGWPLQRFGVVHGPSNHGKTSFVHGLGLSFLNRGHFYGYIDAEFTTPEDWIQTLMGNEMVDHPGFLAKRPKSFEDTVDSVKRFCERIGEGRESKSLPEDTTGLLVVDSLRKLVPRNILEKISKKGTSEGVDGMKGRAAMIRAALTGAWLDELIPMLYQTNTTMIVIGRESENTEAANMYSPKFKLQGGKAVVFDSSVLARVERDSFVKMGSGESAKTIGERHKVTIHKTKVAGKIEAKPSAFFHTSNGVFVPEGFDKARDVVTLAARLGVISKSKNGQLTDTDTGETWRSENAAVKALTDSRPSLDILEATVRERMGTNKGVDVIE